MRTDGGRVNADTMGVKYDVDGVRGARGGVRGPFGCEVERDEAGRIVRKVEEMPGRRRILEYGYDDRGRLNAVLSEGGAVELYGYDGEGRRVWDACDRCGGRRRVYAYDARDRLLSVDGVHFGYDARGRLASRTEAGGTLRFAYDASGRLAAVEFPGGQRLEYVPGANGLPVRVVLGGQVLEEFEWLDGLRLASWRDVARGRSMEFRYVGGARVPEAMTVYEGGYAYECTLGADQAGTIKAVADSSGELIKELAYDSFGNLLADSNPSLRLPLGFAGGLADERTGLVLFGRRWYMPETGRFTAPDPIRSPEGDPDTYEYCIDDPVNRVDPLGLESEISQYPAPRPLDKEIGEAFELGEGEHYWTVTPNEGACEKCQALAGRVFRKEPQRPHPNCKCLIQRHTVRSRRRVIFGSLQGFDAWEMHRFTAKGKVVVSMRNIGPALFSGVYVETNQAGTKGSLLPFGHKMVFSFEKVEGIDLEWEVVLNVRAGDNSLVVYEIEYMGE